MNFNKIRRNIRAISPVISVLLMIAVAVAASLVAYAWVMGYMGFTTNKVGKALVIQNVARADVSLLTGGNVTVYVQNVGDSTLQLANVFVEGSQNNPTSVSPTFGSDLAASETATLQLDGNFTTYERLTIKVVSTDGTSAEYTKTFP